MLNDLINQFSNSVTAIAQIIGFVPMVLSYFVFHFNNRKAIITTKAISDLLWMIHFLMLGAYTGAFTNAVCAVRGFVFAQRGKKKWASGMIIPIIFCIFTLSVTLISWSGFKSLLPVIGSCLGIIGFWSNDSKNIRKFNFPGLVLWLIYGILTLSLSTIICNIVSITSIIITEIKLRRSKV
jgi:hypothetical protein